MFPVRNNYMDKIRHAEYARALDAYSRRVSDNPETAEGFPNSPEFQTYKENTFGIGTSPLEKKET